MPNEFGKHGHYAIGQKIKRSMIIDRKNGVAHRRPKLLFAFEFVCFCFRAVTARHSNEDY